MYPHVAHGVRERITGRFDSRTEESNSEMSRIDSVRLCIVVVSGGVERARFIFWEMLDVSRRRSWRKQTCIQHL